MELSASVADYLASLPAGLAPSLLPAGALRAWQAASGALSLALGRHILLERRLAAEGEQIDLHLAVPRRAAAHPFLQSATAGDTVSAFAQRWRDERVCGALEVDHIWLSYDFTGGVLTRPHLYVRGDRSPRASLRALLAPLLPEPVAKDLARYLQAVPSRPTYVGLVRRRPAPLQMRLIWYLRRREALPLLDRVGWPGEREPVDRWLRLVAGPVTKVGLVLDVSGKPSPHLGLEFMNGPHSLPWFEVLGRLVTEGLCLPEQRDDLLAFPDLTLQRPAWPYPLQSGPAGAGQAVGAIRRYLSHLKLSFAPGGRPILKAYLAIRHGWLRHPAALGGKR